MSTIVTRAGKGSALTHNEVDANFTNLNTDKVEKSGTDPVVISVNSSSDALRITQTGAGNSLVVEDSTNPDSTPFVIDATGQVISGYTSAPTIGTVAAAGLNMIGTSADVGQGAVLQARYDNSAVGVRPTFYKSRSTDPGQTRVSVQSGDSIATLEFYGDDGSVGNTGVEAARITASVDGTPGTDDMPGRLVFSTTADGASSPTERMRINSAGNVGIGTSSPTDELAVVDSVGAVVVSATGATDAIIRAVSSPTGTSYFGMGDTDDVFVGGLEYANTDNSLKIWANNAERMRIDSSGNVGIGIGVSAGIVAPLQVSVGEPGGESIRLAWNTGATTQGFSSIGFSTSQTATQPNALIRGEEIDTSDFRGNLLFATRATNTSTDAPTTRLTIDYNGLVSLDSASGLSIGRTAVTAPAAGDGNVFSGTYTPTLTNTTNVAASTPHVCQYMRVGDVVTVSGRITIDPTASATASEMGISLPIASDITATTNLGGTGAISTTTSEVSSGGMSGDATNNRALFRFLSGGTASREYFFSFTYLVR
jgi:hypothetical protein